MGWWIPKIRFVISHARIYVDLRISDSAPKVFIDRIQPPSTRLPPIMDQPNDDPSTEDEVLRLKELVRSLTYLVNAVQEEERRRIALDLHDQAGGLIAGLVLALTELRREIDGTHPACEDALDRATSITHRVSDVIRETARRLRPAVLDEFGLADSIHQLADDSVTLNQLPVRVDTRITDEEAIGQGTRLVAYRIIQEAITNVTKHAQAHNACVNVATDADTLHIRIVDDGTGMDPAVLVNQRSTMGLTGMMERAASVGGTVRFETGSGKGTIVVVSLPISERTVS